MVQGNAILGRPVAQDFSVRVEMACGAGQGLVRMGRWLAGAVAIAAKKKGIANRAEGKPFFFYAQVHGFIFGCMGKGQYVAALLIHFQKKVSRNQGEWVVACKDHVFGGYFAVRSGQDLVMAGLLHL